MEKKKLEKAIGLMDKNNFKKALEELNKVLKSTNDIYTKNKLTTFINICNSKLDTNAEEKKVDLFTKAVFYLNNNQLDESIEILNNLLENKKDNDSYLYTLSIAYMKKGDEENALNYLNKSIKLNEKNLFYALNEENLCEIAQNLKEE